MLAAILSAQRQQTLHKLNIEERVITKNKEVFQIKELLKTSKPGHTGLTVEFHAYPPDRRLCAYTYLLEYLRKTKICRGKEAKLFVSYRQPHGKVSVDTIARWLKTVMHRAGVDVRQFKPHSTRTAAVSKANAANVPVSDIITGWMEKRANISKILQEATTGSFANIYERINEGLAFRDSLVYSASVQTVFIYFSFLFISSTFEGQYTCVMLYTASFVLHILQGKGTTLNSSFCR
ncbi:hypothetical protein HOLleu_20692 [Holothuria leucospilota]|uniref:Tyr recombinase domain-containing protein n=1 Tax=Holothuria leucospilota TaxID=206669 RepID=A0A9Q1C1R8_HOLLE|nr:hypothetical protein HOLleu_20692 [Holothuria leucospilota]